MRQDDVLRPDYVVNTDPTGASWFPVFDIAGLEGVSITIKPISGTVNGQFKIQTTDFGTGSATQTANLPVTADWVDHPIAAQPSAAGVVSAAIQWKISALEGRWLRVVFTDNSSSSPKVSVAISGRGRA